MLGMPEAVFVEPRLVGMGPDTAPRAVHRWRIVAVQLPFAGDAGGVPGLFHHMSERLFTGINDAEGGPVPEIIFARHDLHAGGGAERLGIAMLKPDAGTGKAVEHRGWVGGSPVAAKTFVAQIIGHDQENIGAG